MILKFKPRDRVQDPFSLNCTFYSIKGILLEREEYMVSHKRFGSMHFLSEKARDSILISRKMV